MDDATKLFFVKGNVSIKEAMRRMGDAGERILFVVDEEEKLVGSLTDGDIRRWVLKGGSLVSSIDGVYNTTPLMVRDPYDEGAVKELMVSNKINWIPVVGEDDVMREVLLWEKLFGSDSTALKGKIEIPVVIMAGGKGTRLDPFTKILPKPLIPIDDKTILEIIMDRFCANGVDHFYIITNHKSKLIKAYFEEINILHRMTFIEEDQPLGTVGGLQFLRNEIDESVFVSNCDIIVDTDYHEILKFHNADEYDITLVGSFRHFVIPYGICTMENGGSLAEIEEKPEYDFLVNTGMYVIRKSAIDLIPNDQFFNVTDLIALVKEKGGKVGVFPIDEKSWIDIGQWEEYHKAIRTLGIK